MKFAPYSFSSLSTFDQCRRKFKYAKIDKAPKSKRDMRPLIKGGAVHSILENFPNPSTHKRAQEFQHIVDEFIKTENAKKYLYTPHTSEESFGLDESLKPCKYGDKFAMFRGKIDHICIIDNLLHLIDFKTGKYKEERWQSFDQLLFYAIYFFVLRPDIQNIKISYVYIEHDGIENYIILDRKYLDKYITQLMTLIKAAESEELYPKTESKLCPWCEFEEHCQKDI